MANLQTTRGVDVAVIGAGAAGLAAAARLTAAHWSVILIEARDRIGGRCWTLHEAGLGVPVELGAEFIHGSPATTFSALKQGGMVAVDAGEEHWYRDNGTLSRKSAFRQIRRAIGTSALLDARDMTFSAYLARARGTELDADAVAAARRMVEGFDGADPRRISARSVRDEWAEALGGAQSRPLGGYDGVMAALLRRASPHTFQLRLNSVVRSVEWSGGHVVVRGSRLGRPFIFSAARAIVTLPLGVLQTGSARGVRFTPPLSTKRDALHALSAGAVLKIVMQFRGAFWETIDGARYRDAAFFHSWRAPFRTMWTTVPLRSTLVTAWAGGPPALKLIARRRDEQIAAAVMSVQSCFRARVDVRAQLQNAWLHEWQRDPFARGAYSYVNAGGAGAREELAAPLDGTLFFAGEATDYSGESGTVAAALESGERAAREVIEATAR